MPDRGLEIKLQMHKNLREEIMESIRLQHRAFISEAFFISIVFSLSLVEDKYKSFILSITPAVIAFTCLWLIEQSRMMRAGDFLQLLEDEINISLKEPSLTWENWLRREEVGWWDIHKIHHVSQYLVMVLFLSLGIFSIREMWFLELLDWNKRIILTIIYSTLIFGLFILIYKVIDHRLSMIDKPGFERWKKGYWEKLKEKNRLKIMQY